MRQTARIARWTSRRLARDTRKFLASSFSTRLTASQFWDFIGCWVSQIACPFRKFHPAWIGVMGGIIASFWAMFAVLHALGMFVADLFKSRWRLEAENLFLRHQLSIALRHAPPRLRLCGSDRALLVWMTRIWPSLLGAAQVVQPETILRWHRAGFKAFWRWKSRNRAGRPKIDRGLRDLIRRMSRGKSTVGRGPDPWRTADAWL